LIRHFDGLSTKKSISSLAHGISFPAQIKYSHRISKKTKGSEMKTMEKSGVSKLWFALLTGMVCSSVLMLTSHSHAASQAAPVAQVEQTVLVTAKRMSAAEKLQVRAELRQQDNLRA
jgi:hypothetical protein